MDNGQLNTSERENEKRAKEYMQRGAALKGPTHISTEDLSTGSDSDFSPLKTWCYDQLSRLGSTPRGLYTIPVSMCVCLGNSHFPHSPKTYMVGLNGHSRTVGVSEGLAPCTTARLKAGKIMDG